MKPNQTIGAYFDKLSVFPGETVTLHAGDLKETGRACTLTLRRLGQDTTMVLTQPLTLQRANPAGDAYERGYAFPPEHAVVVGGDWPSGVYEATLQDDDSASFGRAQFIVKNQPGAGSTLLLGLATHTQQAYNNGQGSSGLAHYRPYERSTYGYNSDGKPVNKVSYDRPGDIVSSWERRFIDWIDDKGIAIDYCSSVDMATMAQADWDHYKTYISVGHDEYWSKAMRDNVEAFRAAGGNCLFLSGNNCYWQVRYEEPGRQLVCYKYAQGTQTDDPVADPGLRTVLWIDPNGANRSANTMTGLDYNYGGWASGRDSRFRVIDEAHWIYQGSGVSRFAAFGDKLLSYEVDGLHIDHNTGQPVGDDGTPAGFEVVAFADCRDWNNALTTVDVGAVGVIGLFRDGGTVFNAGTVQWSVGLDPDPAKTDPLIERMTLNALSNLSTIPLYGFHTEQPWAYAYHTDPNFTPAGSEWIADGPVMYVLPVYFPGSVAIYAYEKGTGSGYRTLLSLDPTPPSGWSPAGYSFYVIAKSADDLYANLKPVYSYFTGAGANTHYQYSFFDSLTNGWDQEQTIFAAWSGPPLPA